MKYVITIAMLVFAFQHSDSIRHFFNPGVNSLPTSVQQAAQQADVVLYATAWCGYCAKARKYFSDHDISYYEYDIETSSEGKRQYDALGGKVIPLMVINRSVIHGYSPQKIRKAL